MAKFFNAILFPGPVKTNITPPFICQDMEATGTKVCLTAMIYLYEGKEAIFYRYEDIVLPLLASYGGKLISRTRIVRRTNKDDPDEIHVISFDSIEGLEGYKADPVRLQHAILHSQSVRRTVVLECESIAP